MDHYGVSYFFTQQEIATGPTISFDCFLEGQLIDDGNGGNGHSKQHHQFAQDAVMGSHSALDQEVISMHRQPQRPLRNQQPQSTAIPAAPNAKRTRDGEPKPQRKRTLNNSGPTRRTTPPTAASNSQPDDVADPVLISVERVPQGKERRRAQMRMAQRAYRQRKENEMSSRAKQLSERDQAISKIKRAFDVLNIAITDAGILALYPALIQPIRDMKSTFESLSEGTSDTSPSIIASDEERSATNVSRLAYAGTAAGAAAGAAGTWQQQNWTCSSCGSRLDQNPLALTRQYQTPDTIGLAQTFDMYQYTSVYPQFTHDQPLPIAVNEQATFQIPSYIKSPSSYSFNETTFASRLMRLCTERAYEVLRTSSLSGLSPKEARVFRLAYRIWNKGFLVERFWAALAGHGEIYDEAIPFLSIGGAGTHYPGTRTWCSRPISWNSHQNDDSQSSSSQQQQQQYAPPRGHIPTQGPLPTHSAQIRYQGCDTSFSGIASSLGLIDTTGDVNGGNSEWFDPQDIEGYLRDMGISLEGHSTFLRLSIPANPQSSSSSCCCSTGSSDAGQQDFVPAYIDVERFIEGLVSKAMCLGRVVGFPKKDVEEQFYNSIAILPQ